MLNLNDFAREVHQNAVEHGWWEEERPKGELSSLIHSEWSEALEEYRANRPMVWYDTCDGDDDCGGGGRCGADVFECMCKGHATQGGCPGGHKPEGIAVELIDGCIRILDYLCERKCSIKQPMDTLDTLIASVPETLYACSLPELVARLHWYTSNAYSWSALDDVLYNVRYDTHLYEAISVACAWVNAQGLDSEALLIEKHEYNKTHPYKHGGKRC